MSNDIRTMRNIRERPTKELLKEYRAKEKQQKEMVKAQEEATREEKRWENLGKLQVKRTEQKARLQEQMEVQKQKAEIKRLRQETGLIGKAQRLQQKIKTRQLAMQKKAGLPTDKKPRITKKEPKIYFIKGEAYHYKSGRMVKVPIGKAKPKKKKDDWL